MDNALMGNSRVSLMAQISKAQREAKELAQQAQALLSEANALKDIVSALVETMRTERANTKPSPLNQNMLDCTHNRLGVCYIVRDKGTVMSCMGKCKCYEVME